MSLSADLRQGPYHVRVHTQGKSLVHVELLPLKKPGQAAAAKPKDAFLRRVLAELGQYLAGKRKKFTLPVSQAGTPFQQAVWKALRTVPYGRVLTYGQLAELAGYPKAARAVGSAMNRNQLPLVVPCHRVVASNGMGGFGCGVEWKKRLLDLEKGA